MQEKLKAIAELSQFYGANPDFVFLGGGNTSVKNDTTLYIKPSGCALATIKPEQFLAIDRAQLNKLFEFPIPENVQIREEIAKNMLAAAVRPIGAGRPSVETPLHNIINYTYIVHLHPALVNGLTCALNGKAACARLFPDALWIDYCDPGSTLAFVAKKALDADTAQRGSQAKVIFLQNHGVFVGADTPEEVKAIYDDITSKLIAAYQEAGIPTGTFDLGTAEKDNVLEVAPVLRQLLADADGNRPIVHAAGNVMPFEGPLTPDHVVYAKSFAFCGEATEETIADFKATHGYLPKVVGIPGKGLFTSADNLKDAKAIVVAVANALQVQRLSQAFGGPKILTEREYKFIENWEVESYRRSVSMAAGGAGRLANRVAVVTGGAQGFGLGIAESLAKNGAIIVIADMNVDGAKATAEKLCETYGKDRAFAVGVNVSDEESVANMMTEITCMCGGLDLFVANAGVVRAGSVKDITLKDWEFVTNINYNGYFLCVKHAARIMARQIVNGKGRWTDIVQVNSKSGLEGSIKNGAYAGSKFGGIGLTQSFAKELVEDSIKVNSVCPGNYLDGPLWSHPEKGLFVQYLNAGKVPGAKTVDDVRKFYEAKVPMRRGCLPEDVAKAIMYCVEQDYETGQAIPVTGGQVMLH